MCSYSRCLVFEQLVKRAEQMSELNCGTSMRANVLWEDLSGTVVSLASRSILKSSQSSIHP